MSQKAKAHEPVGQKTYTNPETGEKKKGSIVPLAKIRADEIWNRIKPYLDQHEIFGNRLVVAVYVTPKTKEIARADGTTVSFELPDTYVQEDVWQGVTGLVVQKGPGAFIDSEKWKFHGQKAEVGEWVTFQPPHSILQKIGGRIDGLEVRIIQDCYIIGRVSGPHVVS